MPSMANPLPWKAADRVDTMLQHLGGWVRRGRDDEERRLAAAMRKVRQSLSRPAKSAGHKATPEPASGSGASEEREPR